MVQLEISRALIEQGLKDEFRQTIERWYRPLAADIAQHADNKAGCYFLGVQGCQGSGKSTLAFFLKLLLHHQYRLRVAVLSIDDFYLGQLERKALAKSVHPLLVTRGVPGTHDLALIRQTFYSLSQLTSSEELRLPGFNKAHDDRSDAASWEKVYGPIDVVIFEGWCVGAPPQSADELDEPINDLEANEDADGRWRKFVNAQLHDHYQHIFQSLQHLIVLNAPSFDSVFEWRLLQEQKLERALHEKNLSGTAVLSQDELKRFIAHYERLTCHCIRTMPEKADWLLSLNEQHQITKLIVKKNK